MYFSLLEKRLLSNAHKVHSIGQSEVLGLEKIFPNSNSFLMPYGFESILNNVPQPKNDEFTIGYVGRLDTHTKGLDLLIELLLSSKNQHNIPNYG